MGHSHTHHHKTSHLNQAFVVGIVLNLAFVIVEFVTGFYTNSLALLSDAGHNLSDVASLGLSLFAYKIAGRKTSATFTYGYEKGTILASLANAVILLIAVGSIGWEAVQRFMHPEPSAGLSVSIVAAIGIVVNTVSALFFFRHKENDLNVKGAYLHLVSDALVSAGVVLAGLCMHYTGLMWIDPLVSLLIMFVVIYGTWGLLKESLRLSLDAVPVAIDVENIRARIMTHQGIKKVYHIHIWAMSTTRNAITAHLVLDPALSSSEVVILKQKIKHDLEHLEIHHATLETENEG